MRLVEPAIITRQFNNSIIKKHIELYNEFTDFTLVVRKYTKMNAKSLSLMMKFFSGIIYNGGRPENYNFLQRKSC